MSNTETRVFDARAQLAATRAGIERDLATVRQRLRVAFRKAEEHAKDLEPGRGALFGRHATTWTKRQERWFQERLADLVAQEAPNIRAVLARLERSHAAEAAQAAKLRVNEPWPQENTETAMAAGDLRDVRALLNGLPLPRY